MMDGGMQAKMGEKQIDLITYVGSLCVCVCVHAAVWECVRSVLACFLLLGSLR